jgi:hypothetical protein
MFRSMTSSVSAVFGCVANGHHTVHHVSGWVESWRADVRVRWPNPPLSWWASVRLPWFTFPAPATSHAACGFTATQALLHHSHQGLWDLSYWSRFRRGQPRQAVPIKEPDPLVQPALTPPLPAEASTLAGSAQVPPNLLLDPVANVGKAPTRMPNRKVLYPTMQDRINLFD